QRLAALTEADRPGQVIVAILTDGLENASTRFSWQDIASRIRHQREKYNWKFLFLGANQDAIATASQIGIGAVDAATYDASPAAFETSTRSLSRRTSALRRAATGSLAEPDLAKSMQAIVSEESASTPSLSKNKP